MMHPLRARDGGPRSGRNHLILFFALRCLTRRLAALAVAVFLAAPPAHATGTVTAWGNNNDGETNVPAGLSNAVAVAGGANFSLALRADGTVAAWGANGNGQTNVPTGLSNVVAVAGGGSHSLALRADGTVVAWGANNNGQADVPPGLSNVVAVAGGNAHSLVLRADGTVAAWGINGGFGVTNVPAGLSNVVAVAAGGYNSLALRADGIVVVWGNNSQGQTNVPAGLSNVVAMAAGTYHILALRADGTVAAWNYNYNGQTTVPAGLSSVVAVAAGGEHSLALRANGTVAAWGYNYYGQATVSAGLTNVVAVAAGGYHSLALSGNLAPFLNRPLIAQTVLAGATVTFRMSVTASQPCFFQWQMNGTDLPGATNSLLVLTNVTTMQAGNYSVIVSNSLGTVTSSNAHLTVIPLVINTQPQGQTVMAGSTVSFDVNCQNLLPLTYQWRKQGANVPGATNNPLILTNVTISQAGRYSVVVSNSAGTVASGNALLKVLPLVINSSPQSQTVFAGSTVSFAASCQSVLPLSYQWQLDGTNLPGANGNPLVLSNAMMSQAGTYSVLVSNSAGAVTSSNALLTVIPLVINTSPQSQTVFAGSTVNFAAGCQSLLPLSCQWRLSGTNLPGATGNPLVLTNVVLGQAGTYSVLVSNSAGSAVSAKAVLTVIPLVLDTNLASQTAFAGSTVDFAVSCQSVLPLSYQWRLSGTNLPGATGNSLVLSNVDYSQAGIYSVLVSNSAITVTSSDALLTVMPLAAWGYNYYGQTNVPAGLSNVVAAGVGESHCLSLQADGTVATWGSGQITVPAGLSNVVAVAGGGYHNLALQSDGTVLAWGSYYNGSSWLPMTVPAGLSNVVAVTAGTYDSFALQADGTVVAWGSCFSSAGVVPITVPAGMSNAVAVAGNWSHTLALRADGTVVAWGYNNYGQTNVPMGLSNVVAVTAGANHSLALRADGTVAAWGDNSAGQASVPAGLSNVVAVAAGQYHSLALRADGTVVAWGNNGYGQTSVPSWVTGVGGIASRDSVCLAVPASGPPFITSYLAGRAGPPGSTVFFRAEAIGARPLHYQWRHNGVDLPGKTDAVLMLASLVPGDAGDYSVTVSNGLGVAAIPSAKLLVVRTALQSALNCDLSLSGGGNSAWFPQTAQSHDGAGAAQSGAITDNQESRLETSVVGPGTLTFWWKVSSEPDYDFLEFYLDGVLQPGAISGEIGWQQQSNNIPSGPHTLRWRYAKDVSDSAGQDAAWLDEVNFTPIPIPFQFAATDESLAVYDGTFYVQLTAPNGASVVVESSSNLKTWTPYQTNTLPYGELDLEVSTGTNQQQFFRARIQ